MVGETTLAPSKCTCIILLDTDYSYHLLDKSNNEKVQYIITRLFIHDYKYYNIITVGIDFIVVNYTLAMVILLEE